MQASSVADVCTSPRDYRHKIGEVRRRLLPSSVNVVVITVMFGVLLTSDVIVDVTATSAVNDRHSRPTAWLRKFANNSL